MAGDAKAPERQPLRAMPGSKTNMSETELLERARRGDREAIEALYQKYSGRVYSVVRRLSARYIALARGDSPPTPTPGLQ